jgi:hypothetical protein
MKNYLKSGLSGLVAVTSVLALQAQAALPASVATDVAATIVDITAGGALMIGVAVAFMGIKKIIAVLR